MTHYFSLYIIGESCPQRRGCLFPEAVFTDKQEALEYLREEDREMVRRLNFIGKLKATLKKAFRLLDDNRPGLLEDIFPNLEERRKGKYIPADATDREINALLDSLHFSYYDVRCVSLRIDLSSHEQMDMLMLAACLLKAQQKTT